MLIKALSDPIGVVHNLSQFEEKISYFKLKWDKEIKSNPNAFYKSWLFTKINLNIIINFILQCLDEFILTADGLIEKGPDKKATVLYAIDKIYEYILKEGLPIWLRPFAAPLKKYIIYVLISNIIDWMVMKYKNKQWNKIKEVKDDQQKNKSFSL